MTGGRYIKQAIIAALCEHPDKEAYAKRAFSGDNLAPLMDALADEKNKLTKEDFFTPDDQGKMIIDTAGFWKNFDKVQEIIAKAGDSFRMDDFTRSISPPDRDDGRTMLDSARQHGGLAKLFSEPVWKGRFDEMERLWFRVPVPARRDVFRNDGLLDPNLKRDLLAAEGRDMPEDKLAAAGLNAGDVRNAFVERGNYEDLTRKLAAAGDYLRKDYLLLPDSSGDTVFYYQNAWDKYGEISKDLKAHGEQLEVADFIRQLGYLPNVLNRAAERKALDKVFKSDEWVDRLPEMLELWSHVRDGWKSSFPAKEFDAAYADAESKTYAKLVDFAKFENKSVLVSPVGENDAGKPVLPLGLRAFWENFSEVQARLNETGEKLTVADLRNQSGEMENSCLMSAVKFGHFEKVMDISRNAGEAVTLDDFLSKDRHGNTMLNILAERNQLTQVFKPELWAGRVADMKTLWTHVRINDRSQVDFQQVEVAAKQATLQMQVKDRFKLKPKKAGPKQPGL
ncbi:MAG: hypothetical protein GC185_05820 [Alphaproteobacteria bacterium]|nr:hypothetical protein [Alphaproteobacteria bacterium]